MSDLITIVMIDSRSVTHPHWVQGAIRSVKQQIYPVKLIVVDNTDNSRTIGECWNEAVKRAETEWVLFLGDDDWLSPDYTATLAYWATRLKDVNWISTYMTIFREDPQNEHVSTMTRMCTGMLKVDYLHRHPFNETLKGGVDKAFYEQANAGGVHPFIVHYHHGYHYRQHDEPRARLSGTIPIGEQDGEIYFVSRHEQNSRLLVDRLKQHYSLSLSNKFNSATALNAKLIWCDWGDRAAVEIGDFECSAKKILRIRAYEAFTPMIHYIPFEKYNRVFFVAEHIKEYVERQVGQIPHGQVIPNGVDLNEFYPPKNKERNNKIAYAGELSRKKGLQLMLLVAEHFPEYEFHVAGKFPEDDMVEYFNQRKPKNVTLYPYSYDLNEFFKDKTYFLLTSPREGCNITALQAMAAGLKPLIYDHVGATNIFPLQCCWSNLKNLKMVMKYKVSPNEQRKWVENYYNIDKIFPKYLEIIEDCLHGHKSSYDPGTGATENTGRLSYSLA